MEIIDLALRLALPILLLAMIAIVFWLRLRSSSSTKRSTPEGRLLQRQFRQRRNQMAEEVMAQTLEELGWSQVAQKMTAEEVAHQLCNRLSVRLWNLPNVV